VDLKKCKLHKMRERELDQLVVRLQAREEVEPEDSVVEKWLDEMTKKKFGHLSQEESQEIQHFYNKKQVKELATRFWVSSMTI